MEEVTLALSLLVWIGLYWLHRRQLQRAYAAGRADERAEQDRRERHGLTALPKEHLQYTEK